MTEKALAAKNAYRRKWAKENKDKIRAQQARYWERRAEREAAAAEAEEEAEAQEAAAHP